MTFSTSSLAYGLQPDFARLILNRQQLVALLSCDKSNGHLPASVLPKDIAGTGSYKALLP